MTDIRKDKVREVLELHRAQAKADGVKEEALRAVNAANARLSEAVAEHGEASGAYFNALMSLTRAEVEQLRDFTG